MSSASVPASRWLAASLLSGGLLVAVGTPAYVAHAAPDLAGYLLHPELVAVEVLPYLLCAALWLPWRAPDVRRTAVVLSALLLLGTGIVHAPMLWDAGRRGGDMMVSPSLASRSG